MKLRWIVLFSCAVHAAVYGQPVPTAFNFIEIPRSALIFGLGNQGVALDGGLATMQYNPAGIASLPDVSFESGKRDALMIDPAYALSWYRFGIHLNGIGAFAFEYCKLDLGDRRHVSGSPEIVEIYDFIEQSYSLSYATSVTESFSAGGTIRYVHSTPDPELTANHFLFSGGVLYQPVKLNNRLTIGFSLTDFGTPVTYADPNQGTPAPAYMRLGVSASPVSNENQKLTLVFEGSRSVADLDDRGNARSSFDALFSSFKHWPRDIEGHTGLVYSYPDINIANMLSFHQRLAFGVDDETGYYGKNVMTASLVLGFTAKEVTIDFGVASIWHYISEDFRSHFIPRSIPDEELELRLSYAPRATVSGEERENIRTTLTAGIGMLSPLDRLNDLMEGNGIAYTIELASYTSPSTAIVSSFSYYNNKSGGWLTTFDPNGKWHTYAISMMYRYEIATTGVPLYVQAGPTLSRWTYSPSYSGLMASPKYTYLGGMTAEIGASVPIGPFILVPCFDFISMWGGATGNAPRLAGLNQWSFGVKAGISF